MNRTTLTKCVRRAALAALLGGCLSVSPRGLFAQAHSSHDVAAHSTSRPAEGAEGHDLARSADEMAAVAEHLWAALTPEQQAKAGYAMTDEERLDWHFIPKPRKGLPLKEMDSAQQALAQALLSSGLSQRGFVAASTVRSLDEILKVMENGKGPVRDPELYFFTVFGHPGPHETWGWRVEGHHLSLNFTIVDGQGVAAGPVFFGSNPAEVRQGPRKGLRTLGVEEDMGRKLITSLSGDVQKKAVLATEAPHEIITGNQRKANPGPPVGVTAGEMAPEQRQALETLVKYYAHRLRPELAHQEIAAIEKAGWNEVHFAWAGGLEPGQGHYYRLHGPSFLVEFDNTQNDANHIHTVWRDSANDFGEDLLRRHYEENPGEHPGGAGATKPATRAE